MEAEDGPAARVGFEEVRKTGLDTGGLVAKRQRATRRGEILRQALAVFDGLDLDLDERNSLFLGFNDASRVAVDIEEVVGETVAGREREFAEGDSTTGFNVDAVAALDDPTSGG